MYLSWARVFTLLSGMLFQITIGYIFILKVQKRMKIRLKGKYLFILILISGIAGSITDLFNILKIIKYLL